MSENNKSAHQTSWNSVVWVAYYICYAAKSTRETTICMVLKSKKHRMNVDLCTHYCENLEIYKANQILFTSFQCF